MTWHCRMFFRTLGFYLLIALTGPAVAQDNGPFTDFFAAADQLDRLVGAASAAGATPPRITDPQVAALFARMTDGTRVFNRTYRAEDLPQIGEVENRAVGFLRLYLDWGVAGGLSQTAQTTQENRNTILYQNEIVPIVSIMLDGGGQILRTVSMDVGAIPADQRASFSVARNGVLQMLRGMLALIMLPGVTPDHQLAVAQAVDRNALDFAGALTPSQRGGMAGQIESMRIRLGPQARATLDHALRAFNSSACTDLCLL